MPKLITTDEQLRLLIPNQLVTIKGEVSLFDKLVPFLDLAEEWFSPELMSVLRAENLHSDLTQPRKVVVAQIKAQIIGYLRNGSFNSRRLADIVNYIRLSETNFAEWYNSATAQLFTPPIFKNKKNASGYFF
ncbi:MAG: hypothetical protein NC453_24195 [Muribaculum sp.]|nr:hypothetical protein [Muribaculum sp.]